jgi:hypothetical protein
MVSLRLVAPLALAGALGLAAAPTLVSSSPNVAPALADPGPVAHASGDSGGAEVYPSLVNAPLVRAEAALERCTTAVDQGRLADAPVELAAVRTNMGKAWSGARFVIRTAPPPVAGEGSIGYTPTGGPTASPESTGFAVLNLDHDVIGTSLGLLDGADPSILGDLRGTIRGAINARTAAIDFIKSIAPPPPAPDARGSAEASGAPVAAGWDSLMPGLVPMFDDEIQQMSAINSDPTTEQFLSNWQDKVDADKATVNQTWPPVPGD